MLTDKPLKIEGNACGTRIVDSLYKAGDFYYFLDIGWPESNSHPDHCIGKMTDEDNSFGEWEFTDNEGREFFVSLIHDYDKYGDSSMMEVYNLWKKELKDKFPDADPIDFIRNDLRLGDIKIEQVG
jgi:hypothetical protein